jgi:hypothetical protein
MRLTKKLVLLLITVLLVVGEAGCMSTEDKVLTYLEDKYNQKFEIEGVKKGSKFFSQMYGGDKVTVHLKNNPEIVFLVEEDSKKNGVYYDNYVLAKWAEELKENLAPEIEKELPEGSPYKILIYISPEKYDKSMVDLSFDDYLKGNKDISIVLKTGIKEMGHPDVTEYNQGIYNLYSLLKNMGVDGYTVSIGFVDQSEDVSDYLRTSYVNNIPWTNLKAKIYGEIIIDERSNPDNPDKNIDSSLILTGPNKVTEFYERIKE